MLKIKKIRPLFTAIITTMDRYEHDITTGGLINSAKMQGSIKEYQRVIAIGDTIRNIKVGDLVSINPSRFAVKKHKEGSLKDGIITDNPVIAYNFETIEINDKQCLVLQDRDINFIIDEFEEVPDSVSTTIIQPEQRIIL